MSVGRGHPETIIYTSTICKCSETLWKPLDSNDSSSIYCSVPPFLFTPTKTPHAELPQKGGGWWNLEDDAYSSKRRFSGSILELRSVVYLHPLHSNQSI